MKTLRETVCLCPVCLEELPGKVVQQEDGVYLTRACPKDGETRTRLSSHPEYYAELDEFFFRALDTPIPQRDFIIRLSEKCNLSCPICLASASEFPGPDLEFAQYQKLLDAHRGKRIKIDLMSAEPTLREDLPELIRAAKAQGHIAALHTNGLKLADLAYLQSLKAAGLDEVHLQLDGFSEAVNLALRGRELNAVKQQALENLEKLNIATDIVMVVAPGLNEGEIKPVMDFCAKKEFIRELFFLGLRSLGRAREKGQEECLLPEDVIDLVEQACPELVNRKALKKFQKLYFTLLSFFGVRKCLYIQHYLLLRKKGKIVPVWELFDWEKIDRILNSYLEIKDKGKPARFWWAIVSGFSVLNPRNLGFLLDFFSLQLLLRLGFNLGRLTSGTLLLGFITACDPYIYDRQVAGFCGKGELSADLGYHDSGAQANVEREKIWREKRNQT